MSRKRSSRLKSPRPQKSQRLPRTRRKNFSSRRPSSQSRSFAKSQKLQKLLLKCTLLPKSFWRQRKHTTKLPR